MRPFPIGNLGPVGKGQLPMWSSTHLALHVPLPYRPRKDEDKGIGREREEW